MNNIFFKKKKNNKSNVYQKAGFTIIEALVLLFIFIVVTTTFYRFFASGTYLILESKKKLVAINLANEKMEFIRSLPYGEVGTLSGIPAGDIQSNEVLNYGNYEFKVNNSIAYFDDAYDGLAEEGDEDSNDYKKIIIKVSWGSGNESQTVRAYSIVAPFGQEVGVGGGTLIVNLVDIDGSPVSGADVYVSNSSLGYNGYNVTNAEGKVSFIGVDPANEEYVITLNKSGYENSIGTLAPYPITSFYPQNIHASVVEGNITNSVFSFSRESDFNMKFVNPIDNTTVPNVNFSMVGGRVLGSNTDASFEYNYNESSLVSNSSGEKNVENMSPGHYSIEVSEPGYVFWKTDSAMGNNANELLITQGETGQTKKIFLLNESTPSYFIKITDSTTGYPIEGATINISETTSLFSDTSQSDEYGYVYFPTASDKLLTNGLTYDIEISKAGYQDKGGIITISQLKQDTITIDSL